MFTINLNNPDEFTFENVRKLLASKDDSKSRQLRVTKAGIAYLSDDTCASTIGNLSFRIETWETGNGYVGEEAASDDVWVGTVYLVLLKNWPNPSFTHIDFFPWIKEASVPFFKNYRIDQENN